MSTPAPPDLKAELALLQQQDLQDQFGSFPGRTLTWVGALPTWTLTLASRLGLSSDTKAAAELVRQAESGRPDRDQEDPRSRRQADRFFLAARVAST